MAGDRTEKGSGSHGNCYREGDCHSGHPLVERIDPRPLGEMSSLIYLVAIVLGRLGKARQGKPEHGWRVGHVLQEQALEAAEHLIVLSGVSGKAGKMDNLLRGALLYFPRPLCFI